MAATSQWIIGRNPVEEALQSGIEIEKVFLQQGITGEVEKFLRHTCKSRGIPLSVVPKDKMRKMVSGAHQGIAALIAPVQYQILEQVLPDLFETGKVPLLVMLDGIQDARNLGAIARSAWVLGVDALIVGMKNNAPINEIAVKASAGALLKLPVCRVSSLVNTLLYVQASGCQVYASDLQAEMSLEELDLTEPMMVIIGSEGEGIQNALAKRSDRQFIIPQARSFDSLNASVASGIIFYEIFKARIKSFGPDSGSLR
ncbi:MAG: 23S rRNA (guanosine(2251)-2'-O)-methyltransferase RlmB [Saprospiraceae bacterium]|nr:23S rRNA (guanosine(2251)-2'-O)-methyltransferase RlmB [Saprospiraceae bacterium]